MKRLEHIPGAGGWTAAALVAAPLILAACVATPGGTYGPPRTPPPQRPPERVVVVEPPRADFSGDWELTGPGNAPRGEARGRERNQVPPGQARERGRDEVPPGQAREQGRDEGPPGQIRAEQDALAAGAAPRLRIVQDDRAFTVMREGAAPLTLSYDGRPVYFRDARGATTGEVSGRWREGRRFEIRWAFYGRRVVTETYELNGNGMRLTVRNRVAEGTRPEDQSALRNLVYQRVSARRP
jgi:hypothetical protein